MSLSCEIVDAYYLRKLRDKYNQFLDSLNDPQKHPEQIFTSMGKEAQDQIELVREVSKCLQKKKEEEVNAADAKQVEETKTTVTAPETPTEQ